MLSITLFVDDDAASGGDGLGWGTAYNDLQSALTQAATLNTDTTPTNDVDRIWIAEGTYRPSVELKPGYARTASFSLVDGVTLYGGFIGTETTLDARDLSDDHATILSGDLGIQGNTSDNAYTVVYCAEAVTAAIDGLWVVAGNADDYPRPNYHRQGGGIYSSGVLTIANSTISNNSANYDGGGVYNASGTITITNSTISNNTTTDGGGIYNSSGTLTIIDSTISDNVARNDGGGIYNSRGTLSISNSTLSGNTANFDGGGIYNNSGTLTLDNSSIQDNSANYNGGGIYGGISVSITHSNFENNSADKGGGIYNLYSNTDITIAQSSFVNNSAVTNGGGIYAASTLILTNSTISDNSAGDKGGGIYSTNSLTIINSVISKNLAEYGGGIYNWGTHSITGSFIFGNSATYGGGIYNLKTLTVINSTISGNTANDGAGINNHYNLTITNSTISVNSASRGGGIYQLDGTSTLSNTIIAKNVACSSGPDMHYTRGVLTAFHCLIGDGSETSFVDGVDGNQVGTSSSTVDPMLSDLTQFNNGKWGYYLLPGSPAIDTGDNSSAVDENGQPLTEDMAGNARIIGTNIDIGAVEGVAPSRPAQTYVVTSLDETIARDGVLTFLEAFQAANSNQPVGDALAGSIIEQDVIQFDSSLFTAGTAQTILLDDGELVIVGDLSIIGPGSELLSFDAAMQNRVFTILPDVSVSLSGITITGGLADTDTRLYYGGGIYNFGDLTLTDSVLSNNSASRGGGINNASGTVTLTNCTLTDNSAQSGGGIRNASGTLTLNSCVLTNNSAQSGGGFCNAGGTLTLTSCVLSNNSAQFGGGIDNSSTLTIANSTITDNSANVGGGIYNTAASTTTLSNLILWKNEGGDFEGTGSFVSTQNLIGIDPQFVDPGAGDYRLQASSPAINYGDNSLAVDSDGSPIAMDLDGHTRVYDATVDCGAFEFQSMIAAGRETPSLTVTTANDFFDLYDSQVSLREAIYYAASNSLGTKVVFDAMLDGSTITLLGDSLFIDKSLTIDASSFTSLTIGADSKSRVITILARDEDVVELNGLTIIGGSACYGGGIYNSSKLTFANSTLMNNSASSYGGGIYSGYGTLALTNVNVSNNSASSYGGGIYSGYGTLALTNVNVSNNSASSYGGGIYSGYGTLVLANVNVSNNSVSGCGGGIYTSNPSTLSDSILSGNSAVSGGGIYCDNGATTLTLTDCTLSDNSASSKGGGIFSIVGSDNTTALAVSNSAFSGNSASEGGGVYSGTYSDGVVVLTLNDSTFSENTASKGGGIYNGNYFSNNNYGIATVDITGCEFSRNSASNGGGIYNSTGTLTLTNSTLSGNSASYGGGIVNCNDNNEDATATTLINTTLTNNSATTSGGGVYNGGYGDSVATLTILDCTFSDNSATYGGGILNQDVDEDGATTLTITGTTLSNNTASQNGGGIYNYGQNDTATLAIVNSIFSDNSADSEGGGIYSFCKNFTLTNSMLSGNSANSSGGIGNSGTLTLTNSILVANAAFGTGGGIGNSGTLTITNSTLLENSASGGGGIYSNGLSPAVILNNTIVAKNSTKLKGPDIQRLAGTLSGSHNLIGDGTDQTLANGTDGNQVGTAASPLDPMLSTLTQFNNGQWGHYLLSGSPAIDAGDNSLALDPAGQPLAEDIGGNVRVIDSTVDIGAVEGVVPSSPGQTYIVTSLDETIANDGILTFLEAFQAANSNQPHGDALAGSITEPDTIQFDNALFADGILKIIFVDDGELNIWGDLNIEGPGAELLAFDAAEQNRVLNIPSGISVNLEGVTITGGSTSDNGGGIYNNGTLTITNSSVSSNSASDDGGGIFNHGILTVTNSLISNNSSSDNGGGIYNDDTLTITNSSLWNNSARNGGGIYNNNEAAVVNVAISDNSASDGGGIYNYKTLSVTNSTIARNTGSGIYLYGTYTPSGSSITVVNNSIVANNGNSIMQVGDIAFQWRATVTGCNNLIGNSGYSPIFVDGVDGNQVGSYSTPLDPMLSDLTQFDNGLWGYYLLSGSPAIDAGNNALATDPTGQPLTQDILGNARILNDTVDIGAQEGTVVGNPATKYVVTSLEKTIANDGVLTFIEALEAASRNQPVGDAVAGSISEQDVIQFADGVAGTYLLDGKEITLFGKLSIQGSATSPVIFDANRQSRVFSIQSNSSICLSGISITGGFVENSGGGINNQGTLVLTNCTFFGNSANSSGGAIANGHNSSVTLVNSIVVGNSAQLYGAVWNMGEFTILNSTLTNNITKNTSGYHRTSVSVMTIHNSILWQNVGILYEDQGSYFVSNNLTGTDPAFVRAPSDGGDGWGDKPSTSNIDESANDDYGDLRLTSQSTAINYGDNNLVPEGLVADLDGNYRIANGTVDIGAYEFGSTPLLSGDANGDGKVDGSDVTILAGNWQAGVTGEPNATWTMGDFNRDGKVDGSDVTILAGNWQAGVSSTVVAVSDSEPETEPVRHFVPPANASLGVATVPRRESLPQRRFIAPTSESNDAVLAEATWCENDYTAVAKDLVSVSAKKSTAASDELFALEINPYADFE